MKTLNLSERDIRLTAAMRNVIKRIACFKDEPDNVRELIDLCYLIVNCPVKDWEPAMERIERAIAAL